MAAGTIKISEVLVRSPEGYEIRAVEPHAEMSGRLETKTANLNKLARKRLSVSVGMNMKGVGPMQQQQQDTDLICNRFAKDESLEEFHSVLRPKVNLGLIWNTEEYNKTLAWPTPSRRTETCASATSHGRPS